MIIFFLLSLLKHSCLCVCVCVCHVFVRWCVTQQRNEVFMALMLRISKQNTITWPTPRMHGTLPPWVHRLFINGR